MDYEFFLNKAIYIDIELNYFYWIDFKSDVNFYQA